MRSGATTIDRGRAQMADTMSNSTMCSNGKRVLAMSVERIMKKASGDVVRTLERIFFMACPSLVAGIR